MYIVQVHKYKFLSICPLILECNTAQDFFAKLFFTRNMQHLNLLCPFNRCRDMNLLQLYLRYEELMPI